MGVKAEHKGAPLQQLDSARALYWRLLSYVRPYWRLFAAGIAAMVVLALTEPAIPALMKPLLDGSFIERDPKTIRLMPLLLVLLFLVRGLSSFCAQAALGWIASRVVMDIREQLFGHLLSLPGRYYDQHDSGNLVSRLTFNVNQVAQSASSALLVLVRDSLALCGLLAWMLYLNWRLTLLFLLVVPVIGLLVGAVSARMRRLSRELQSGMGRMTHLLGEAIRGHRVIKLFAGQVQETQRFHEAANALRRASFKISVTSAANVPLVQLFAVCALALIVYAASSETLGGGFTAGSFISFFGALGLMFAPIKRLTNVNEELQRGLAASADIFELLQQPSERDTGRVQPERVQGHIAFRGLHMRYAERGAQVLAGIDLEIAAGETVALVGRSGSGKTTLAALIPRFYEPMQGQILIDGVDIREWPLAVLRAQIALVSQDVVLFNDSVAANIAYGARRNASEDEIRRAAQAAHAFDFIERMPQGMHTLIGENGVRLSGGQRQRIAIARALLKDAPILILDEATSALDNESERRVHEALDTLLHGRTAIVIAHRLSTVERADRIVVLDQGRVVETGDHATLLARGGPYARMHAAGELRAPVPNTEPA